MRFADLLLRLQGATSGETVVRAAAAASGTVTLPGGTTDFSATGGASQVVRQSSAGGAFTVGQLAASDVTGALTSSGVSGMTAGQIPMAATATTITSSVPTGTTGNSTVVQTNASGNLVAGVMPAYTGDVTSPAGSSVNTLANTAVTAAAYTHTALTVDGKGRITAAANGTLTGDATLSGNAITLNTVPVAKGGTGATTAGAALTNLGAAPLASPSFTGTPAAPTATAGTSTTQIATTAFVQTGYLPLNVPTAAAGTLTGTSANRNVLTLKSGATSPIGSILNFQSVTGAAQATIYVSGGGNSLNFYDPASNWGLTLDLSATQNHSLTGNLAISGNATVAGSLAVGGNANPTLGLAAGNSATVLFAPDGTGSSAQIGLGVAGSPTNFHRNTTHLFQDRTAANTFATISAAGMAVVWCIPNTNNSGYCGSPSQAWAQANAYNFATVSDARLKTPTGSLPEDCLSVVEAIPVKSYQYLPPGDPDPALEHVNGRTHWGFVAQDVAAVMEAAGHDFGGCSVDPESGVLSLSYNDLVACLWKANQELAARVGALEARLALVNPS